MRLGSNEINVGRVGISISLVVRLHCSFFFRYCVGKIAIKTIYFFHAIYSAELQILLGTLKLLH
jgi:hypothetical protein